MSTCYGDAVFRRYAMDQDFIETIEDQKEGHAFWFRFWLGFWKISCNYGQSLFRWGLWSIFFALLFAGVFTFGLGQEHFDFARNASGEPLLDFCFETMLYYSIVTFTTLGFGDVFPATHAAARWVMAEVIVGYIMLGGLISILATKLARRS